MRDFIISIVISAFAPLLIGLALNLRIKRKQRDREATGKLGIATAAAVEGRPGNRLVLGLVCGAFIAAALSLLLIAGPADAKPKQIGVDCTTAQTVKASKCMKQVQDDLINDVANPHFLVCLADGSLWCCRKSSSGSGNNCTMVRTAGPGSIYQVPLGNATNAPPTNAPATNAPTAPGVFGGVGVFHKAQ